MSHDRSPLSHSFPHQSSFFFFLLLSYRTLVIATKGDNKSLCKWLIYMGIFSILLTCIIFGVSIAAAQLSKETKVDRVTGVMSTKGTDQAIHTSPLSYYLETLDVVGDGK